MAFIPPKGSSGLTDVSDFGGTRYISYRFNGCRVFVVIFPGGLAIETTDCGRSRTSRTFLHQDTPGGRIERYVHPNGELTELTFDANGNVAQRRKTRFRPGKPGTSTSTTTTDDTTYFPGTRWRKTVVVTEDTSGLLPGWTRTSVRHKTTTKTYSRKPNRLTKIVVIEESIDHIDDYGVPIPKRTRTTKQRGKNPVVDDWNTKTKKWIRRAPKPRARGSR